jgi:hypothetical protein
LKTQWDILVQDQDAEAQLLLRVAGQFPEAAVIPMATLAWMPTEGKPANKMTVRSRSCPISMC